MGLLVGIFLASLAGSVHCAAMCGGFVCAYAGLGSRRGMTGLGSHAAYHAGRLVSYVTLGLVAGAIGQHVDRVAQLARVERGATIVAGTLMVVWATVRIATALGARVTLPGTSFPSHVRQRLGQLLLVFQDQSATVRAGALGLLTTLLPCGWLYLFVVTAGSTGSPIHGAAVMATFWLGTVPLLLGVGLGVQWIGRPLARHLPIASAALVLVLGVLSLAGKLRQIPTVGDAPQHAHPHLAAPSSAPR